MSDIAEPIYKNFHQKEHRIIIAGVIVILFFLFIILNRAWACDDSYISFRAIDNFLNGFGLRWNIQERVQIFTHPLWLLIISLVSYLTGEVYLTSIFTGVVFSLVTVVVLLFLGKLTKANIIGILLLSFSSAYVDYSTSGLENSLTHLLLAVFALLYFKNDFKHRFFLLSLTCGLAGMNRLDTVVFFLPALTHCFIHLHDKKKGLIALFFGFSPIWGWMVFSIIYYGFPLPNTFYAKLNNWPPRISLISQGVNYLINSLINDPITILVIFISGATAAIHRNTKRSLLTAGAFLYLFYVVWIGGDFMQGRFLTGIFLVMVIGLILFEFNRIPLVHYSWIIVCVFLSTCDIFNSVPPFLATSEHYIDFWRDGIVNERSFYWEGTGLFREKTFHNTPELDWIEIGKDLAQQAKYHSLVTNSSCVGFKGYYAGPNVYIIDELGLGNALTARMPPIQNGDPWRIGHFPRVIPDGYPEYLETNDLSLVKDDKTREYLESLELVIEGPFFTKERWKAIYQLNLGHLDENLVQEKYKFP